jgi:hypothetical protein
MRRIFLSVAQRALAPVGPAGPDLDTLAANDSHDISGVAADAQDVFVDSTGINCIIVSDTPDQTIASFTLSTPFDITTLGTVDSEFVPASRPFGMTARDNGTKVYVSNIGGNIEEYTLSTPWLWSSRSLTHTFDFDAVSDGATICMSMHLKEDGRRILCGGNGTTIHSLTLSTPWDLSTASYDHSFDATAQITFAFGVAMDALGTKMYVSDLTSNTIYQYTLGTVWNVTTASYASKSLGAVSAGNCGLHFDGVNNNGQLICVYNTSSKLLRDFT